jgi:hypothetical protein
MNGTRRSTKEVGVYGNIEKNLAGLPGITERRFNQLQEIEAVLNYLNIQLRKIRKKHFQKYLENINVLLTSRDVKNMLMVKMKSLTLKLSSMK